MSEAVDKPVRSTSGTMARLTRAAYLRDPAAFKEFAIPHLVVPAIQAVAHGAAGTGPFASKGPQRWAVRIALQVAGWLDQHSEVSVVMRLAEEYGLKTEAEVRQRLELAGRAQGVGLDSAQARALELLQKIMAADPGRRETIRASLFGDIAEAVEATEKNGRGSGSPARRRPNEAASQVLVLGGRSPTGQDLPAGSGD